MTMAEAEQARTEYELTAYELDERIAALLREVEFLKKERSVVKTERTHTESSKPEKEVWGEWIESSGLQGQIHKVRHPILPPEEYERRRRAEVKAARHMYDYCMKNGIPWETNVPPLLGKSPHPEVDKRLNQELTGGKFCEDT